MIDSTCSAGTARRRKLADVLEGYLSNLERGAAEDHEALLAAHPDLAEELRPYLDSLRLLHGTTRDMRSEKLTLRDRADEVQTGPRQIGDYRIVREIGRGGMGIVYEAHQTSLNRRVALKVLPFAAVLDQRQIARFRNEAQAAAQLHHPHIVPVFAVGQEQGVYYYAMHYIQGQTLAAVIEGLRSGDRGSRGDKTNTEVIAAASTLKDVPLAPRSSILPPSARDFFQTVARLGKEAAQALEHAHQYGIVHRDIKPSNLLVDEDGKLWVTDFGLARMQSTSGVTLTGDVVGTLRYMSPEQASGQAAMVDARTDVYSLGASLYELLTQRPAFPGDDRATLVRQISGEEPLAPRRINPGVPVDLETIVLAAMHKSRDERYASAQALAEDLDRYLAGKPTQARRPTLVDRAAKWARRHRPLVAVGACAMATLIVIMAIGMALLAREQARTSSALADAERSFERAERHYRQARGAVDQFGMRLADRLLDVPGAEPVRREALVDTLRYYREFAADAQGDPQLQYDLAIAHFKSGVIAARLGDGKNAIAEYEMAICLLAEQTAAEAPRYSEALSHRAIAHNNLGLLLAAHGDVNRAQAQYTSAIDIQRRLVQEAGQDANLAAQLAESWANLGMLLDQMGEAQNAEEALREAVDALRRVAESNAREPKYGRDLAIARNNLSYVVRNRDAKAAEAISREAITTLEHLVKEYPNRTEYQDDLALCANNLAALKSQAGMLKDAIAWHEKAIGLQEPLMRRAPAVVRHRSDLAVSLNNLGVAYCRADRPTDADAAFDRARELLSTLASDYPNELAYQTSLAALLNNQALALAGAERHGNALPVYVAAIQSQRGCWERRPASGHLREALSKMYFNYGRSLRAVGRTDEAAQAALARRELWRENGERLLGVAAELAQIARVRSREPSIVGPLDDAILNEVMVTLREAHKHGLSRTIDLSADERFASFAKDERFVALLAELNAKGHSEKGQQSRRDELTGNR